ncbi:MAG: hypothetical protein O3C28_05455 [Proteobacteria bacterium]|nr:hypothetical protein [Pseudomonadota bacterium]
MTLYLAAGGQPFSDPDAAAFKADRMHKESGGQFQVVPIDGGYAVEPRRLTDTGLGNTVDRAPATARQGFAVSPSDQRNDASIDQTVQTEKPFVFTLRPAWRAQLSGFCFMLIGGLLVVAPTWPVALFSADAVYAINNRFPAIWDDIALSGFAFCLIGIVVVLVRRYWQKSVITNDGVMQSVGILIFSHVSHINMANVHVVDIRKPNLAHILLNLGTVELSTPGSAGADVAIVDVVSPKRLATFIRERVAINKSRRQPDNFT